MDEWRLLFGSWLCAPNPWGAGPTPSTYIRIRSDRSGRIYLADSVERRQRRLLRKVASLQLTNCGMSTESPRTTPDTQMLSLKLRGPRRRDHRIARPGWTLHRLPHPPRSPDRTRSPGAVSRKREYFKYPRETIGDFAPAGPISEPRER